MSLNPKRTVEELKELRALTGDANGAQRVAWTDTWLEARKWFASKVESLPVEHHYDAAGNNWVTLPGASPKALLIGGHLDSVPNGGWLDGALNVVAGLEVLRRFATSLRDGRRLRCGWWIGRTKRARDLGGVCLGRRHLRGRIRLRPIAGARIAMA